MYNTLISVDELAQKLNAPRYVVIDCRFSLQGPEVGRQHYEQGHIAGACYAHLDADLSGPIIPGQTGRHPLPDVSTFAQTLGRWGIDAQSQVIAYDDMGGPFAARFWWMLKWLGHEKVAVLDGGWPVWLAAGHPTSIDACKPTTTTFVPHLQDHLLVTASDIEHADSDILLVDARAEERHAGRHEPLDPVAGHIPSAVCYPWAANLDADKHFLEKAQLRDRFQEVAESPGAICYCGSGVTAAHNALAIVHAGYPMPRLYAGSWSEWITDPSRPVATA